MKFKVFILIFFISKLCSAVLGLNDVSILLPLPRSIEEKKLLIAPDRHQLLPLKVYNMFPTLNPPYDQSVVYHEHLKVVGIRFDPCFSFGFSPQACRPQVRLVWQPIVQRKNNSEFTTVDVAVHTFYDLDFIDWDRLKKDLISISKTDVSSPLQIHPTLSAERYEGPYWNSLLNIVFNYASQKNLSQATVMTLRADRVWAFSGFHFKNDEWQRLQIPTLSLPSRPEAVVVNQAFVLDSESLENLNEFKGSVTMLDLNNRFKLISDSKKFFETQTEAEIIQTISMAYDLENPRKHNPGTIDCVSCHISQTVRQWGYSKFPNWKQENYFDNNQYSNSFYVLKNQSINPQNTNRVRSFGYFDEDPVISQRVINETAELLKYF
jgi:hypothetical protein